MTIERIALPSKAPAARLARNNTNHRREAAAEGKEVPIQVMVPEGVRRQVALMSAERGENIRTVVLRGLRAIGISVPESELGDRRGRRRQA
jgi:hypothetical protein